MFEVLLLPVEVGGSAKHETIEGEDRTSLLEAAQEAAKKHPGYHMFSILYRSSPRSSSITAVWRGNQGGWLEAPAKRCGLTN